ncbi:hypothetical protein AK812_SmicGene22414 [Symbiodinium microadriaticum]|uniref:Uncharacterized protein n=1 Tax=Symbiodinium microadriaticum TaxID=2951 RepID=A0A1Q9DJW2_SYMMI|nr:hypothetical protein AK812_SmicGene22414 [Symbiodinium microadriaticum]
MPSAVGCLGCLGPRPSAPPLGPLEADVLDDRRGTTRRFRSFQEQLRTIADLSKDAEDQKYRSIMAFKGPWIVAVQRELVGGAVVTNEVLRSDHEFGAQMSTASQ